MEQVKNIKIQQINSMLKGENIVENEGSRTYEGSYGECSETKVPLSSHDSVD
jgi:hypothetical protein